MRFTIYEVRRATVWVWQKSMPADPPAENWEARAADIAARCSYHLAESAKTAVKREKLNQIKPN